MAFQLSPGVNVSEVDLTTVVPSVATTVGGLAGNFAWGPVEEITLINDEVRLVDTFGKPDTNTFQYFFTAANFLSYGSDLRLARAANTGTKNATTSGTGVQVKNVLDYNQNHSTGSGSDEFIAKWPGAIGNALGVSISDANTHAGWAYSTNFDSAPSTSDYATNKGGSRDELHIVVYDRTGLLSGTAGTVLEKFAYVSKASDAKKYDGTNNYYKDVLNSRSQFVYWMDHTTSVDVAGDADGGGHVDGRVAI